MGILIVTIACAFSYKNLLTNNYYSHKVASNIFGTNKVVTIKDKINTFIDDNNDLIAFYSDTFQIEKDKLTNLIYENNIDNDSFNENDIFNTGTSFSSKDESILNYLLELEKTSPKLFSNKKTPCDKSVDYILSLIDYYGSIYTNVDISIAKAIGLVESGYRSKYMMQNNNVFGGMANGRLIAYKNINYGILKYMELLSKSYFGKGLTTISQIGYKYNPTINGNGVKVASPTWVANVTNYTKRYNETSEIAVADLVDSI